MRKVTLDVLIRAMLLDQPYNHPRLGRDAKLFARRLSNRFGRDLPDDVHEEVATEAIKQLLEDGPAKLETHSAIRLFSLAAMKAIRVVRASYVQPGVPTRRPKKGAMVKPRRLAAEDIGRVADALTIERCMVGEGQNRVLDFDQLASAAAETEMQAVADRIDTERLLNRAPPEIAAALRLVFFEDAPKLVVAKAMRLSRFALERRFRAVGDSFRLAA